MASILENLDQQIPYLIVGEHADQRIDFLTPKIEQVRVRDFALSLAKSCRYNGAVPGWYSTAEHCILGARKASTVQVARQFMIHDAGEYVFSDLPAPVKRLLEDYKKLSDQFDLFLLKLFTGDDYFDPEVHEIDQRMCATEQRDIRKRQPQNLWAEPYKEGFCFYQYEWREAYEAYLRAFRWFFPEVKI